jgi:predicted nucleic acid-binding protein
MIVLDTNVLSELMRPVPDQQVIAWVDAQPASDLVVTSITVAEILYGIARMDDGKRKQTLHSLALAMFAEDFAGNVLPFDLGAAEHYAELVAQGVRWGWQMRRLGLFAVFTVPAWRRGMCGTPIGLGYRSLTLGRGSNQGPPGRRNQDLHGVTDCGSASAQQGANSAVVG